jgi:large subunit ribosomal protein L24
MQKLRVNDEVILLAGKDKGKTGKIKKINFKTNRVSVDGVNKVKKALKPTQENPNGGLSEIEATVHISNVALISPKTKKATRVKIVTDGGKKVRALTACSTKLK